MPNFKSISFKMAMLQGGGQNLPSPCVCYPKDPMWNRVKWSFWLQSGEKFLLKPWKISEIMDVHDEMHIIHSCYAAGWDKILVPSSWE